MNNPLADIADIAASQIGHHEDGSTNTGSEIAAYQAATELGVPSSGHGWPWCCAFVDWVIAQFIARRPGVLSCEGARPRMASVAGFVDWARASRQLVFPAYAVPRTYGLAAGDLVAWHFSTGHHIGIVRGSQFFDDRKKEFVFLTVEGNTSGTEAGDQRNGGEVAPKIRSMAGVMAFVRLAVKATV